MQAEIKTLRDLLKYKGISIRSLQTNKIISRNGFYHWEKAKGFPHEETVDKFCVFV